MSTGKVIHWNSHIPHPTEAERKIKEARDSHCSQLKLCASTFLLNYFDYSQHIAHLMPKEIHSDRIGTELSTRGHE